MTLSITYDGGSISSNTAFSTFEFVEMAYRGEVGQGSITIDDATATRNIVGLKTVVATESQDVTDTRLFTGLTERRQLGRGDGRIAASEREWTVGLTDMNDVLRERVITSGKRPAETDVARATWLVGSGFLPGVVGTYISASGPVTLPATNYAGKYGFDVLTDCQDASSKNFFVTWNGSSLALFYDFETSSNFASALRISDTPADIDYVTTFPPDWDNNPGLERDPGEVYSGMWLEYNGGHVLYQSGTIASNFRQREVVLFNDRPKTATQATALATSLVTAQSVEEDRISLSIHVDRQYVNKVRAGQRILLKARALGLTDFTAYRVVRKSTKPGRVEGGSPTRYTINLELAAPKKVKNRLHSVGTRVPVNTPFVECEGDCPDDGGVALGDGSWRYQDPIPPELFSGNVGGFVINRLYSRASGNPATGVSIGGAITYPGPSTGTVDLEGTLVVNYRYIDPRSDGGVQAIIHGADDHDGSHYAYEFEGGSGGIAIGFIRDGYCPGDTDAFMGMAISFTDSDHVEVVNTHNVDNQLRFSVQDPRGAIASSLEARHLFTDYDGEDLMFHIRCVGQGDALDPGTYAKVWAATGSEPVSWMAYRTNAPSAANLTSGAIRVAAYTGASASPVYNDGFNNYYDWQTDVWTVTNLSITGMDGSATICDPPTTGQPISREQIADGDGSTVLYYTNYPYAVGGLRVEVNGVDVTADITETDPDTGRFTFGTAPLVGAEIRVSYVSA